MFGSRGSGTSIHKQTLTEFLQVSRITFSLDMILNIAQEMDGLKSGSENKASSVIVVGATNRPQDLDDAILRRLPRRVLVDLPTAVQRESPYSPFTHSYIILNSITEIIRSYLAGEDTDATVDITSLAERTVAYSGSDLKHLVFSAALAAFKDTLPHTWAPTSAGKKLPGRVIGLHHFEQALKEIVASASVNMAGIAALRKWGGSSGV